MAANMQSSFWYYRGMLEGSDSTGSKLLVLFLTLSTLTGAIFICNLVYSFIRLIFSLFFLPGKSVCLLLLLHPLPLPFPPLPPLPSPRPRSIDPIANADVAPLIRRPLQDLGGDHRRLGWHWAGIRHAAGPGRLLDRADLAQRRQTGRGGRRYQVQIQHTRAYLCH